MSNKDTSQLAPTKSPQVSSRPHLVFRSAPHMDALVFTSLERALEIDRLHRAISDSKTWGEFRTKIGSAEYARLFEDQFYRPQPDDDPEDINEDVLEPKDGDPFTSDAVPGFCDGDYPPWLAQEIGQYVPRNILSQFAERDSSVLNGPLYKIDSKYKEAVVKALTAAGFLVEERKDLEFW